MRHKSDGTATTSRDRQTACSWLLMGNSHVEKLRPMNGDELADTLVLSRIHYPLLIGALLTNKRIRDKRGIV